MSRLIIYFTFISSFALSSNFINEFLAENVAEFEVSNTCIGCIAAMAAYSLLDL